MTFGHYRCCTISGCVHRREPRRGSSKVTSGSHATTTKKKTRKKAGHSQNLLSIRTTSGQGLFRRGPFPVTWFCSFRSKSPTGRIWRNFRLHMRRTYFRIGSLPVTWLTSLPVTWLTVTWLPVMSLPVTSLPVAPHCSPSNNNLSVPIYYSRLNFNGVSRLRTEFSSLFLSLTEEGMNDEFVEESLRKGTIRSLPLRNG